MHSYPDASEPPDDATEIVDPMRLRAELRVGKTLREKWHLDVLLGLGGMAAVYAATHRNESRAAIKVLHPEFTTHPEIRTRFLREGRAANRIGHPGVVRVLDDDVTEDGAVFIVMELLDGESLDARVKRNGGQLLVDEVLAIADQLLDVLAAAHDKGVVHRDLKPENVFLTREGEVKVLDFGIARLRELSSTTGATRTGTSMGTPAYMSPEQARGLWNEVDARSDVWSTGATLFFLLTGRPVHKARTANEALILAATNEAPGLESVAPDTPAPVAGVVDRALAFERDKRWQDARAMQHAVRRAYEEIHSQPISSALKPVVPPAVPDRTLPSLDAEAAVVARSPSRGTVGVFANGVSEVPLLGTIMRLPKPALIGGAVVAALIVAVVLIVVLAGGGPAIRSPAASERGSSSSVAVMPTATVKLELRDAAAPEREAVSVEDLPAEQEKPSKAPALASAFKPKPPRSNPSESHPAPTPTPAPAPRKVETDTEWRERRR